MATVIDALVMTLGLDVAEFDKARKRSGEDLDKFKKQANAVAKDVAHGGKVMAEGFRFLKTELLGLLAVAGAATGIKEFVATTVTGQAELGRLGKNLDMSGAKLYAWGVIAEEMGGKASDAFGALQAVAGGLAEASIKGQSALTQAAAQNGIDLGGVKDAEDGLMRISKRLIELPRQQAMYVANQLGVGSMFNELMLGPDELRKRREEAEKISGVTQQSIERAQELQRKWALLTDRLSVYGKTGGKIFEKLEPVLNRLVTRFADWLDTLDWDKVGRGIETVFNWAAKLVSDVDWSSIVASAKSFADEIASAREDISAIDWGPLAEVLKTAVEHAKQFLGYIERIRNFGQGVRHKVGQWAADHANDSSVAAPGSMASRFMTWLAGKNGIAVKGVAARGVRNHNPGNLEFAGQLGAHLEAGPNARFAAFDTDQEGIAALVRQLALYTSRGIDTISSIVKTYAPKADGNDVAAYIADLVKSTGHGANDRLNLADLDTLIPLVQAIARHEGNGNLSTDQVLGGIRLGARQQAARGGAMVARTSTSETHIGKIEVHTPATDAKGIARDIGHEMRNNALVAQADTGLD